MDERTTAQATTSFPWIVFIPIVAALGVGATDWPLGWTTTWAVDHPVWTSVVANFLIGLVILLVGAFVLEDRIRKRQADRWRKVALLATLDLAQAMLETARGLQQLVDLDRFEDRGAPALPRTWATELATYFDGRPEKLPTDAGIAARLAILVPDHAWADIAHKTMTFMKQRYRDAVAKWAPVMVDDPRLASTLVEVASIHDALQRADFPLAHELGLYRDLREPGWEAAMGDEWQSLLERLITLKDELTEVHRRAAGFEFDQSPGARLTEDEPAD